MPGRRRHTDHFAGEALPERPPAPSSSPKPSHAFLDVPWPRSCTQPSSGPVGPRRLEPVCGLRRIHRTAVGRRNLPDRTNATAIGAEKDGLVRQQCRIAKFHRLWVGFWVGPGRRSPTGQTFGLSQSFSKLGDALGESGLVRQKCPDSLIRIFAAFSDLHRRGP